MAYGSIRVSKVLTNVSVAYRNEEYIAGQVLKDLNVIRDSGEYWVYSSDFRLPETKRAKGTPANMVSWEASLGSYIVNEHALKDIVTDTDRENSDLPDSLDKQTTEYLTDKILMRMEYEAHKLLFTTTTFSGNATLTTATAWKYNTTTSAPIQNVLSATGYIRLYSGKTPNTMILGWDSFAAVKENTNVYSRIQYAERAIITEDLLASLFDIQKVYVGKAAYNQGKEGATVSQTSIWGSDALLAYFAPAPGLKTPTTAVNIRVASKGVPFRVKTWRDEAVEGDYIEVQTKCAPKAVATASAYLFKTVALS